MLEEFRRRKNMRDFYEMYRKVNVDLSSYHKDKRYKYTYPEEEKSRKERYAGTGPERYFEPRKNDAFNPS